jgi:arabinose-5-phosphate isomerase
METAKISYFSQGLNIIDIEIAALKELKDNIDEWNFDAAIELLRNCQGKIVLLGVGKSGLIAQKIAATLSSTCSPAINLHPADALHGDLGIVDPKDVIIAISYSGETLEIVSLLPYLKARKTPIIAIVGNTNSTLAENADVVLNASVQREACPLNLAPTTSTTVALVIGDTLAVTLMQVKNIKPIDFAYNHPSGSLGKKLVLKVKNLMHTGQANPRVQAGTNWSEIVDTIDKGNLGAVSIVDDEENLIGIITDGDIRRSIQKYALDKTLCLKASDMMTPNPITAQEDMLAYEALLLMENRMSQISVLPVVDLSGKCVGMIRVHDLVGKL